MHWTSRLIGLVALIGMACRQQPIPLPRYVFGVRYGPAPHQLADIYRPCIQRGRLPAVILLHPGGWFAGCRGTMCYAATALTDAGACIAVPISYSLTPENGHGTLASVTNDIHTAVDFCRTLPGVDSRRIVLAGGSAGGHLALLYAYSHPNQISGIIAGAPPTDLVQLRADLAGADPHGLLLTFNVLLGQNANDAPSLIHASPISFVSSDSPPTLLIHSSTDDIIPADQSTALLAALERSAPGRHRLIDPGPIGHSASALAQPPIVHTMVPFLATLPKTP